MKYIDIQTLRFLLFDTHRIEDTFREPLYEDYDREGVNTFLKAVKDTGDQDFYPAFREMDEQAAVYQDGTIVVHQAVKKAMEKATEVGLMAAMFPYEVGGLQMPITVYNTATLILDAANNHLPGYPGLTIGAANLIHSYANEALKETYFDKMLSGEWAGTMALTEPQAGSSLSDITTTATPTDDDYYQIKGQKIFISGGDHQLMENFVHLVLARIEGAPAGTRGISLFVVPKHRPEEGGLSPNDVTTAGDFQKMGQKGYCTAHLIFGENSDCRGWLVGEANQGLKYMFQMMNSARIATGRGATGIALAAYYASLQYANERPQGRRIMNSGKKDLSKGQTLIINHPDVRRMLLLQKAVAEGSASLVIQTSLYRDLQLLASTPEEHEDYDLLLELITPVCKTYPSEMGRVAVSNGLQVLGGYGFCTDFVLQQYYRDIRIFALYEGTTGIQSLDLLGRKVMAKGGRALQLLAKDMRPHLEAAATYDDLRPYGQTLEENMQLIKEVIGHLAPHAQKGEHDRFLSDATIFMEMFSTIIIGWQWLKAAVAAKEALVQGKTEYSSEFYESKIHTMRFFFKYEMTKTRSLADIIRDDSVLTLPKEQEVLV